MPKLREVCLIFRIESILCENNSLKCIFSRDNMSVVLVKFAGAKIGSGEGVAAIRRARELAAEEAKKQEESEHNFSAAST